MRKIILTFCTLIFCCQAFAQKWTTGAEFGLSAAWVNTSKSTSPDIKSGPAVLGFDIKGTEQYNFGNGALRSSFGFSDIGGQYTEGTVFKTIRMFYLSVPLDLIYQQHKGEYGFFGGGGVYGSLGLGGQLNTHPKKKSQAVNIHLYSNDSQYGISDAGAQGILGYKLKSGFEFDALFNDGFSNIISKRGNPNNDRSLNIRMLEFNIGYVF